jgi:hypothetical protein
MSGECGTANAGINYRALKELFNLVERRASAHFEYTISVSIVEVYNETVRDLLSNESANSQNLSIREGPDGVFLPDCRTAQAQSVEHVWELMKGCHDMRASARFVLFHLRHYYPPTEESTINICFQIVVFALFVVNNSGADYVS